MISFLILVFELLGATKTALYFKHKFLYTDDEVVSIEFDSVYNLITNFEIFIDNADLAISHKDAIRISPLFLNKNKESLRNIDGVPEWSLNDDSFGSLTVSDDGFSAVFVPFSKTGLVRIDVLIDSDVSVKEKAVMNSLTIHIDGYKG